MKWGGVELDREREVVYGYCHGFHAREIEMGLWLSVAINILSVSLHSYWMYIFQLFHTHSHWCCIQPPSLPTTNISLFNSTLNIMHANILFTRYNIQYNKYKCNVLLILCLDMNENLPGYEDIHGFCWTWHLQLRAASLLAYSWGQARFLCLVSNRYTNTIPYRTDSDDLIKHHK